MYFVLTLYFHLYIFVFVVTFFVYIGIVKIHLELYKSDRFFFTPNYKLNILFYMWYVWQYTCSVLHVLYDNLSPGNWRGNWQTGKDKDVVHCGIPQSVDILRVENFPFRQIIMLLIFCYSSVFFVILSSVYQKKFKKRKNM